MSVKQDFPSNVMGSASGNAPGPSHTMTLFAQSASFPGGGAMNMPAPFPSSDPASARNTLPYSASLGASALHFQNAS